MKRIVCGVSVVLIAIAECALGADIVWTGSADGLWGGSGLNWTNASGSATAFAAGDSTRFDDGAAVRTVRLSGSNRAGDILFDAAGNYTLTNMSGGIINEARSFIKRGTGTLTLACWGHTFTNDVRIEEGAIETTIFNTGAATSPLGNMNVNRQIYVGNGASLNFRERNTFGGGEGNVLVGEIFVDQGGAFSVANGLNTVGSLTLNGGSLSYTRGNSGDWGVLKVCNRWAFGGLTPYMIATNSYTNCFFNLNFSPKTTFHVADITGGSEPDVTFDIAFKNTLNQSASGLIKTGPGTLKLLHTGSTFTGDIEVREGELLTATPQHNANATTTLGNAQVRRVFRIHDGAALTFSERNTLGSGSITSMPVEIIVEQGGAFNVANGLNTVGSLTLNGGAFTHTDGFSSDWGILKVCDRWTFGGTTPYTFLASGYNNSFINLNHAPKTTLHVEDISGDSAPDAIFEILFKNTLNQPTSGFVKTGPGTLELRNRESTFTGDVEIREGTVSLNSSSWGNNVAMSPLGNPLAARRITVSTNATLQLKMRNSLSAIVATNTLTAEIYVDHGTLMLGETGAAPGVNVLGSLTLDNGELHYSNMYNTSYGFMKICRRFTLKGTAPYDFPDTGETGCFMSLNMGLHTIFDVKDITGDSVPDATFRFQLRNNANSNANPCGIVKDGEGTMRLTAASAYTRDTLISNGVLQVDGSIATSPTVTVFTNGWLGGTGTVNNVAVQTGGGFAAAQGQMHPLSIAGNLTLEPGGIVRVSNPDGLPGGQVNVTFAEVTGSIIGAQNLADWTVDIEGVPSDSANYRVRLQGKRLVAGFAPRGTLFTLQ